MSWFTKHIKDKSGRIFVLVSMAVIILSAVIYSIVVSKTNRLADEHIAEVNRQFERIAPITQAERAALRTYRNEEHVEMAQRLGISGIRSRATLDSLTQRGALVELKSTPYYVVREMEHAAPFVTPSTRNLLELIGIQFQHTLLSQGLPPYKFVISSATRTEEAQEELQETNINAAEVSSHQFGTTVDLLYSEFVYAPEQDTLPGGFWISRRLMEQRIYRANSNLTETKQAVLKAVLGRVLRELQREDYLLVIYERRQPVFHITLARDVPDPSPNGVPMRPERPIPISPRVASTAP